MANGMCIIANKGYYYKPHFVRAIGKNTKDVRLKPYLEKHKVTNISDETYDIIQDAMQDVVESGTGATVKIPGIDFCAKTGTVQNKAIVGGKAINMPNHSMFVAFAPRKDPKIAIVVAVENAGFGSAWAAPIASLMIEKYLNDSIATNRKPMEDKMLNGHLINKYTYVIDSVRRIHDKEVYEERMERKKEEVAMKRVHDSEMVQRWFNEVLKKK
jgi:penicillin-binding protein 2